MVDLKVLEAHGITQESLKALWESDKKSPELMALDRRISGRIQDGIQFNCNHWKVNYAIDQAWDTPLRQISPTLIRSIAAKSPNVAEAETELLKVAKDMGLAQYIADTYDPKTGKVLTRKKVDIPALFEIVFPIMRAYTIIRAAKIVNERDLTPLFKYEASKSTELNRRRCEVITDRVETISTTYGYYEYLKQNTLKCLLYSSSMMFPQEQWHSEQQIQFKDDKETTVYVREGIRYSIPHPNRTYCDQAHPLSTINTDSGCEFYGYWRVVRYKDIRLNKGYWNKERVGLGSEDWRLTDRYPLYMQYAYSSCQLKFPDIGMARDLNDREGNWYASDLDDAGVVLTEHFEKCIPSDDGLGDYKYPVWFRFVRASDNSTLYCAPLPSHPGLYFGGDNDEGRIQNGSQALEILPFQDQISNLLTQALLAAKQNLTNVTIVNTDIVGEDIMATLENWGEKLWRKLNFLRASYKKQKYTQNDITQAFGTVRFPQMDVSTLLTLINQMLNLLERVMQTSSQEVGSYASHEQSAEEIKVTSQSTSQRIKFTSTPIDRGCYAWKCQIYDYLMAYGEPEFYAQIPASPPLTKDELAKLGFTIEEKSTTESGKHLVKANKTAIRIESFASTRDADDRVNNVGMAQAMSQFIGQVLNNQALMQSIGAEQAVHLMNQILDTMGLPRDFKLRYVGMPGGMTQEDFMKQQLVAFAGQVKQLVAQTAQETTKEVMDKLAVVVKQVTEAITSIEHQNQEQAVAIGKLTQIAESMHGYDPNAEVPLDGQGPVGGPVVAPPIPGQSLPAVA